MSSRYMNYLRKNGKFIMVVMSIVCMITFVVGAALSDWANSARRGAQNENPIAVTWVKGKVHNSELELLRRRHVVAHRFLLMVIQTALERGGKPVVNGRQITPEQAMQGMIETGIPADNTEESAVQTMVLAEEARRMGIVVDNDAVFDYLRQISSPELKQGDWQELASQAVDNMNISVGQLIEHLAYEFRAQHVRTLMATGLYSQGIGMPIVPPAEAFDMFNRLNRKLAIEAYPVEVEPYISEVKGQPTNAEVEKLFDEGRFRDPNPNVDEPGFHKPHKLAFKYLKVSFAPFLEEAKQQITDAQIEEAYQKDVLQGLHKVQELPAEPEKKDSTEAAAEKPADEKSPGAAKDAAKPADEKADVKPSDTPDNKSDSPQAKPTDKGGCEVSDDPPAGEKPSENKVADEKAAEPKTEATPSDKPAVEKADTTSTADAAATPPAKEPKFKPLTEVRDQILTRLAQPIAEEARKKAVAEVTTTIEKYGKALRRYNDVKSVKKTAELQAPPDLDLAPLVTKYNFPAGETPLVDRFDVAKYEIGQKVQQLDMQALQMFRQIRMLTFADIAFSQDEPLYKPDEARSSESDVNYIYFRTAEEKPADVTLKEVQPQVVEFWKKRKAFELALADAQKLTDKAKGAATLGDVVPDRTKVVEPPAFSWMSAGGFGMGQPEMSTVKDIELAGREFMQGVFALKPNEVGTASNQAHSRIYVVRAISQEPDDARLQSQFAEMGYNQLVLMLASGERQIAWFQSLRNIEDQYRITWQRPPRNDRRM